RPKAEVKPSFPINPSLDCLSTPCDAVPPAESQQVSITTRRPAPMRHPTKSPAPFPPVAQNSKPSVLRTQSSWSESIESALLPRLSRSSEYRCSRSPGIAAPDEFHYRCQCR